MARDGTARGSNIKVNAGRKSKALAEKMATGNPGGRKLKIIDLPDGAELEGEDIPEPSSYIKSKQKAVGRMRQVGEQASGGAVCNERVPTDAV